MKGKKYALTEEEYNNLLHQLVTSDNLVATDKEKYLKKEPDLFWMTDNSKQIKMLEGKKPIDLSNLISNDGKIGKDLDLEIDIYEYFIASPEDEFLPDVGECKSIAKYIRQLSKPNQLDMKILADIGMTMEVLEDYIIDKQWVQVKKHFYHIKNQLGKLSNLISNDKEIRAIEINSTDNKAKNLTGTNLGNDKDTICHSPPKGERYYDGNGNDVTDKLFSNDKGNKPESFNDYMKLSAEEKKKLINQRRMK